MERRCGNALQISVLGEEITELTNKVKLTAEKTQLLFAFFNNHWQGYAPRNATDMKTALQLTLSD